MPNDDPTEDGKPEPKTQPPKSAIDLLRGGATDQSSGSFSKSTDTMAAKPAIPIGPPTDEEDSESEPTRTTKAGADGTTERLRRADPIGPNSSESENAKDSFRFAESGDRAALSGVQPALGEADSPLDEPAEGEASGVMEAINTRNTHYVYEVTLPVSESDEPFRPWLAWAWPLHPSLARVAIYLFGIAAFLSVVWATNALGLWNALENLTRRGYALGVVMGLASAIIPGALLGLAILRPRSQSPLSVLELIFLTGVSFIVTVGFVIAPWLGTSQLGSRAAWLVVILALFPSQALLLWLRQSRHDRSWLVGDPRGYALPFATGLVLMGMLSVGAAALLTSELGGRHSGWVNLKARASGAECKWLTEDVPLSKTDPVEGILFDDGKTQVWVRDMMACVDSRLRRHAKPLAKRVTTQDELPRIEDRNSEVFEEWAEDRSDLVRYAEHLHLVPPRVKASFEKALKGRAEKICSDPFKQPEAQLLMAVITPGSEAATTCEAGMRADTETWISDALGKLKDLAEKDSWTNGSVESRLDSYLGDAFRAQSTQKGSRKPEVRDVPLLRPVVADDGVRWEHPLTLRLLAESSLQRKASSRDFGPEIYLIALWDGSEPPPSWSKAANVAELIHDRWPLGSGARYCGGRYNFEATSPTGDWFLNVFQDSVKSSTSKGSRSSRSTFLRASTRNPCTP